MRRWIAVLWHASFLILAGVLYFFFVLPRWNELTGAWSETLGTAMRIVCGVLIGLSALPVVFTWLRTRKPEYGTPTLALTLRVCSIALQVLAGVLIVGAAISEIWLSLDSAGAWLFGIYGAAAALAVLGAFAFHLAYVAELPPPPPKPLKPKSPNQRRGRGKAAESESDELDEPETTEASEATEDDASVESEEAEETVVADEATEVADGNDNEKNADKVTEKDSEESDAKLRNRRPEGKSSSRLFRRSRGGVALDD
jgi:hypothetical protein